MGLRETARKYGVTHKMVQTWIKLYLEKGKDCLYNSAAKHKNALIDEPSTVQNIDHTAPRKARQTNLSKLDESSLPGEVRDELNMLRMENAYLKKLNALVRKKEKSQIRIKLK
jgi:transposase